MDDGYSGTNFDRPEFQRMCRDIEKGKVRCILTKDMSRLGRNSARTTDLLEEYFPAHQVRYIAVSEGYDSRHMTGGMAMTAPLMMVINEMYARDISQKIRSAFQSKMENGQYIGHHAPYGYQKDPENKNHLVMVIRRQELFGRYFRWQRRGSFPGQIAKRLNQNGIPTPSMYRQEKDRQCGNRKPVDQPQHLQNAEKSGLHRRAGPGENNQAIVQKQRGSDKIAGGMEGVERYP